METMIITQSESNYLSAMRREFGTVFGVNYGGSVHPSTKSKQYRRFKELTPNDKELIIEARKSGKSWKEVCRLFGISAAALQKIQAEFGYTWPNQLGQTDRKSTRL